MSNSQFSININKWIESTKKDINEQVITITSDLFRQIHEKTPEFTGHLRYNWLVSFDAPKDGTRGIKPNENLAGQDFDTVSSSNPSYAGLDEGLATIRKFYIKRNKSIWITNNVDYAYNIEYKGYIFPIKGEGGIPYSMVRTSIQNIKSKYKI